jgi:hypothetical protein
VAHMSFRALHQVSCVTIVIGTNIYIYIYKDSFVRTLSGFIDLPLQMYVSGLYG